MPNLDLSLTLGTCYERPTCYDIRAFEEIKLQHILDIMERPLKCYVKLELNSRQMMRWERIAELSLLRRFKTVIVEVGYPSWQYTYSDRWQPSYEEDEINRQRIINYIRIVLGTDEEKRDGPELTIISKRVLKDEVRGSSSTWLNLAML